MKFTGKQRYGIATAIKTKQMKTVADMADGRVFLAVLDLIDFSQPERDLFMRDLGNGQFLLDPVALDQESLTREVELESAQAIKLAARLEEWRQDKSLDRNGVPLVPFGVEDLRWYVPLIEQLESKKK